MSSSANNGHTTRATQRAHSSEGESDDSSYESWCSLPTTFFTKWNGGANFPDGSNCSVALDPLLTGARVYLGPTRPWNQLQKALAVFDRDALLIRK